MATVRFVKGHGTGNDFVLIADADAALRLTASRVAALCDRHFGVGADGILRAVRSAAIPEGAGMDAEWFMDYRNADGSIAEMCGNGIRVFTRFLLAEGLASPDAEGGITVGTRNGERRVQVLDSGFEADLGRWELAGGEPLVRARALPVARPGLGISVGNPHVVVALASLEELESADLTVIPHLDPEPPDGANIEFVVAADPLVSDGVGHIRMRVHERGSGETLSCGTGAVAAALATRHWAGRGAPDRWRVDVPGGTVGVRVAPGDDGEHAWLSGPAELVFEGVLDLD